MTSRFLRLAPIAALLALTVAAPAFAAPGDKALTDVQTLSSDDMQGPRAGHAGFGPGAGLHPQALRRDRPGADRSRLRAAVQLRKARRNQGRGHQPGGPHPGTGKSGKAMVVSAHYDHLGVRGGEIFNGADDNASGVAGLLAVAEAFKAHPPKHDVILAVVDAEEGGLRGAKAFVANPPVPLSSIVLDINFDMLSKNPRNELYASGTAPFPVLKPILVKLATQVPVTLLLGHDTDADGKQNNWSDQSDHYAFGEKGVPWIYFGVEDHPEYHKSTDDFATIPQDFFKRSIVTVIQASLALEDDLDAVASATGR
jgi:hypothetical protein